MKCKCKNKSCGKEYDPTETERVYGSPSWIYDYCSDSCFTQSIMKKLTTNQFVLYEPIDGNVIAGPVEANNRGDAVIQLLDAIGYEVMMVEKTNTTEEEKNDLG